MSAVILNQLIKSYPDKKVLNEISLAIETGEFIVIVGPSGCGKSTLLRSIAGLETIDHGEIYIGDKLVNKLEPKDRNIAMVFQNYALYPHMNVFDNMAYGLKIRGFKRKEIEERVHTAAEILKITEYLLKKPSQLSGGQRQRVAMGRAMVRQPDVFLFDEPLSNLDAELRVKMRLEIKKLHLDQKTTSIYVTHDQMEAMTLADRLVVMNKGQIEQIGTPLYVYRRPATCFVASFIGSPSMNFIPAVIHSSGQWVEIAEHYKLLIDFPIPQEFLGKTIKLGLRPENINEASTEDPAHFDMSIDLVESIGSDTFVYGHITDTSYKLTARLPGKWLKENPNKTSICLTVRPNSLHLFDIETEKRIKGEQAAV